MLREKLANIAGMQQALALEPARIQESVDVMPQATVQPGSDGHAQAAFIAKHEFPGKPPTRDLFEQPLGGSAPDSESRIEREREFRDVLIELGCSGLDRRQHRCAIYFGQKVVAPVGPVIK